MKLEIIERGVDVLLATRSSDNGPIIVPRKNEVIIHAQGKKYFVREVNHYYYRAMSGADDVIEVLVEAE